MVDLVEYRPKRLEEVRGHPELVKWMVRQISSQEGASVLLSGPVGIGKTLSGRLYAKAISCNSPDKDAGCGKCVNCVDFEQQGIASDVRTYQCGERSTVAEIREVVELARISPIRAKRRVILFDELHNLSARASEGLLAITERPPRWTTFILMTSKLDKIPKSIQSRLTPFDLKPFDKAASLEFVSYVCGQEQKPYEAEALSLLAHVIPGSPRWLLRSLNKLFSDEGKITEQMVRDELDLNVIALLQSLVGAVLRNDHDMQFEVLRVLAKCSEKKLEFLQSLFGTVYFDRVLHIRSEDPVLRGLDSSLAAKLSDRVSECAVR